MLPFGCLILLFMGQLVFFYSTVCFPYSQLCAALCCLFGTYLISSIFLEEIHNVPESKEKAMHLISIGYISIHVAKVQQIKKLDLYWQF